MKLQHRKAKLFLTFASLLLLIYFATPFLTGYHYTESAALEALVPMDFGEEIYKKEFEDRKVVILDIGDYRTVQLIHSPYGLFHQVRGADALLAETEDGKLRYSWSARLIKEEVFDVVLAAEVLSSDIEKVVVLPNYPEVEAKTLKELQGKVNSLVEIEVENGYAVHYFEASEISSYAFAGVDAAGNIVSGF
ncbi:hypothetical protein [Planococcus salinarum]|uniref:hypothetical protein n=1 Tax=Planococcus salinarum TaxID=622695 RepID=UPI000E3D23F6|nr:hypothetical protein [Planococcus salinarum]TAA72676.1 hypothetical protein D2909_04680 [Planococcus salinarum]